jgi:hypothetical protein
MNTERTVVIENVGDAYVSLRDTQGRNYLLKSGAKMRISSASLQDILDSVGSKRIFDKGNIKIGNISRDELYAMGLNEDEIELYLIEEVKPAVVITPAIEEKPVAVIEIEEPVVEAEEEIEETVEEAVIEEEPVVIEKPVAVKKPAAKKTTNKKTNSKKGK